MYTQGKSQEKSKRFFPRSIATLYLIAPFIFIVGIRDFAYLPQLAFIETAVSVLTLIFIFRGIKRGKILISKNRLNLPIIIFILWCFASLLYATNSYEALLPIMHLTSCALLFFLIVNEVREEADKHLLITNIFTAGYLTATIGIFQYLYNFRWIPQVAPPAAVFGNKNLAVHFIVLAIPLSLPLIINTNRKLKPWIISLMWASMITFLVYTRTRAGWLSFWAEIIFIGIVLFKEYRSGEKGIKWDRNKSQSVMVAILLVLLMANFTPEGFRWSFGSIAGRAGRITDTDAQSWRRGTWKATIEMIKDNPIVGVGLGNLKIEYPYYHNKVPNNRRYSDKKQLRDAHNDYLQGIAETGLIGLLLIGWIGVILIKNSLSIVFGQENPNIRTYAIALTAGFGGLMVNAFFSFPLERPIPPIIAAAFAALIISWGNNKKEREYKTESKPIITTIFVIALSAALFVGRFNYNDIKCDWHLYSVDIYEQLQSWEDVIIESKKAYSANPHRTSTLSHLGIGYIKTGKHREAIETLKEVIAAYPHRMNDFHNLGVAYYRVGDYEDGIKALNKVLSIKPDYANSRYYLGNIYLKQKRFDKALAEFKTAIRIDPNISAAYYKIGLLEVKNGEYQKAAKALEKAVELRPNWTEAHKNLGILYIQSPQRKKEGIEHLKKALALNPKITRAKNIRKILKKLD